MMIGQCINLFLLEIMHCIHMASHVAGLSETPVANWTRENHGICKSQTFVLHMSGQISTVKICLSTSIAFVNLCTATKSFFGLFLILVISCFPSVFSIIPFFVSNISFTLPFLCPISTRTTPNYAS